MRDGRLERTDIEEARKLLGQAVHRTPLWGSRSLSEMLGVELHLKAELFQKTGSFKPRGLLHKLKKLPPDARERGLISISAGNAAAALAWGASRLGAHATVVMPAGAATSKVEATRAYGGEVVPTEGDLLATCRALEAERGLTFVHPFDDLDVMAGHGTVGLEILEDLPDAGLVVVPVGGGGLIGGMAAAIKAVHPATRVVGVEPVGAPAMTRSLAAGEPIHLDRLDTIADGLAAPFAGEHTLAHVQAFVDDVVTVEDEAIIEALRLLLTRTKLLAEPSGAAALAALTAGAVELPTGKAVVCVVSGGNVDVELLREVL